MTIREAVDIYNTNTAKIERIDKINKKIEELVEKGVLTIRGLYLQELSKYLKDYQAVLEYDLDQDFAN